MDKTTSDTLKQVPMVAEPMTSYPADMNVPISTDSQKQVPMVAIPIMQPPEDTDYLGFTGQVPMVAISLTEEEALRIISDPSYTSSADLDAVGKLPNVENLSISTPIDQQNLEPATVVILNHEIFNDTSMNRPGSSKDVESLYKTFHKLGCSIEVHHNPVFDEVSSKIKNLSRRNFKLQSALIIVILSHGHPKEEIEASDNQKYDLDTEVVNPLLKNPTLKGKPKILVVQACKGVWEADANPFRRDPLGIMKCYSTTEGFLSYRHSSKGSVYIQTFCEVMNKDALTKDFRAIVNDVNQQVIKKTEKGKKQVPSITSTLYESYCFGDFVLPALKCIAKPKSDPQRPLKASSINPTNPKPIKTPAIVEKILNAPRPLVLILNHHIFIDGRKREGTAQDVQALHRTFTSLNCDVLEILNPTWDVVKETFNKLEGDCLKHLPALVIVILSHGDRNDVIGTCDNKRYNLNEDVLYPLFRNETLVGKPKILITQACKGNLEVDAFPIKYSPTEYIKCYSTTEGFKSYRDPEKGSPYIQALCTHLEIYGQDWDFESLIREVGIQVASQTFEGKRQIPTFVPRLNKKFYFGHNVYTDGNPNTLNN